MLQAKENGNGFFLEYGPCFAYQANLYYFTEEGLKDFAETGYCGGQKEDGRAMPVEERIWTLAQMMGRLDQKEWDFGIIKHRYLKLTKQLKLFLGDSCGLILILQDEQGRSGYIQIKETSICRAFRNYVKWMQENEEVYNREETRELLIKYRRLLSKES